MPSSGTQCNNSPLGPPLQIHYAVPTAKRSFEGCPEAGNKISFGVHLTHAHIFTQKAIRALRTARLQ